jgi:hypothetical protein
MNNSAKKCWPILDNTSWIRACLLLLLIIVNYVTCERIEILMSNVTTQKEDAYICTSFKLDDDHQYISKYFFIYLILEKIKYWLCRKFRI